MGFQRHDVRNGAKNLGRDVLTNRMLTGGTQTVILRGNTAGEKDFEAGLVLKNETVAMIPDDTRGWVYDTSNDYYKVKIGTTNVSPLKLVNMYGEEATYSANCLLKGTKVLVDSEAFPQYSGSYTLVQAAIENTNDCVLYLSADAPGNLFGDADLGAELADTVHRTNDVDKIFVTVLPFAPAFCVEMLGVDGVDAGTDDARTTPATFRMNNVAGTAEQPIDYPDGQVVYGEITHFTPQAANTHYAILYCQDKPSLEFSPYNQNVRFTASNKKSAGSGRHS